MLSLVLAMTAATSAAAAADCFPERQFDRWTVYGWEDDCWMKTTGTDGTEVLVSTEVKSDQLYVVARNAGWTSIKDDKTYPIQVVFGDVDLVETGYGSAGSRNVEPGFGVFLKQMARRYFATLRASKDIRLSLDGKRIASAELGPAATPAIDYLERCTVALRAKAPAVSDPFANRTKPSDPFKDR